MYRQIVDIPMWINCAHIVAVNSREPSSFFFFFFLTFFLYLFLFIIIAYNRISTISYCLYHDSVVL